MLETIRETFQGKISLKVETARKFCKSRAEEESAQGKEMMTLGVFDDREAARMAADMFSDLVRFFRDNPDVLNETVFRKEI